MTGGDGVMMAAVDSSARVVALQDFVCPDCGYESAFDPWIESACCPSCGFSPPSGKRQRAYLTAMGKRAHKPLLDELLSHWNGTHTPDTAFSLETPEFAELFFADYRNRLGEDLIPTPDKRVTYLRRYYPERQDILAFAGAHLFLRRGDRARAAQRLLALVKAFPEFVDAWVWLTATTDDPTVRQVYLEEALRLEPGHPLARDAFALAMGQVSLTGRQRARDLEHDLALTQCAQCGGALHHAPGLFRAECPYCGASWEPNKAEPVSQEARPIFHLQLQRRCQGHSWAEVQRVVNCRACGAQTTMTRHLAQTCAYCGSNSLLVRDNRCTFEQPDGFIPFKVDEREAASAIRMALQGQHGWDGEIAGVHGLYLPFWVFDGVVEIRWWIQRGLHADLSQSPQVSDFKQYENLHFPALLVPPPSSLKPVQSFDLTETVPYAPRLLADWPAQLYDRDVEEVAEEASHAMTELASRRAGPPKFWQQIGASTMGEHTYAAFSARRVFQVHDLTYQLALLPFWLAPLWLGGQPLVALVNGQTGDASIGS